MKQFTDEMTGGRSVGRPDAYVYASLEDRVPENEMKAIREFLCRLLVGLAEGMSILLVVSGVAGDSGLDEEEDYLELCAHSGDQRMNGEFEIAEIVDSGLSDYAKLFGRYDSVKGIVVPAGGMRPVVRALPLFDPVPATEKSFVSPGPNPEAIAVALEYGTLFFEEVKNGTRLRIVCAAEAGVSMREAVSRLIADAAGSRSD